MIKTRDWTIDELKILLAAGARSPAQLVECIPNHAATAIGAVQQGVHALHTGRELHGLSSQIVDYLETQRGGVIFPVCGRRW